jgi:hypothetical protein
MQYHKQNRISYPFYETIFRYKKDILIMFYLMRKFIHTHVVMHADLLLFFEYEKIRFFQRETLWKIIPYTRSFEYGIQLSICSLQKMKKDYKFMWSRLEFQFMHFVQRSNSRWIFNISWRSIVTKRNKNRWISQMISWIYWYAFNRTLQT